jgi:PTS system nitrogen regulatory IIA component
MLESDLLVPGRIFADVRISSKKRLLEFVSQTLAKKNTELSAREIFESLCNREILGSTALGNGVAIPHGRVTGIEGAEALFLRLSKPLLFDTEDGQAVDLVFAVGFPIECSEDHSKLLSSISSRFSDPELQAQLRAAADATEIWQLLSKTHA